MQKRRWRKGSGTVVGILAAAFCVLALVGAVHARARAQSSAAGGAVGIFAQSGDVGTVLHAGTAKYDPAAHAYVLTASGENIWATADAFQFAWKKMSGDVSLSADISFMGKGVNPHRKAVLMIRQTLDADSPYVDAALHGSGLISLQYRQTKGGPTAEIETKAQIYPDGLPLGPVQMSADMPAGQTTKTVVIDLKKAQTQPIGLRIDTRDGKAYLYMRTGAAGAFEPTGASIPMPFSGEYFVGIGLSSHDKDVVETAAFTNVELAPAAASAK